MEAYHRPVTAGVTFNPFLPAIGRVYQVLLDAAPAGETIETNNRKLAEAAQCSAGTIPGILRDLEALEYIERVTGSRGSLILVVDRSNMFDRSFTASGCDQESDRQPSAPPIDQESDRLNRSNTPDRSAGQVRNRSTMADPPHTPLYGKTLIAAADSVAALEKVPLGGSGGMPITPADRWPDRAELAEHLVKLGCDDPSVLDAILVAKPQLELEQLESQWQIALQREQAGYTDNARALLFGTLRKPGSWLHGRATSSAVDWGAYAHSQASPPPAAPGNFEAALDRARVIAPDASAEELERVAADIADGISEATALESLSEARARREYLARHGKAVQYAA